MSRIHSPNWHQSFVTELHSQIEADNRCPGRLINAFYTRRFYVVSRVGRVARIVWGDGETYELSTGTTEREVVEWKFTDEWQLAKDGQHVISGSSGSIFNAAEAARAFLMMLEIGSDEAPRGVRDGGSP